MSKEVQCRCVGVVLWWQVLNWSTFVISLSGHGYRIIFLVSLILRRSIEISLTQEKVHINVYLTSPPLLLRLQQVGPVNRSLRHLDGGRR